MKPSIYKRKLKGEILDKLFSLGFRVGVTDSTTIAVFTDKPVNDTSVKIPCGQYITSWGVKGAEKFLQS